MKLVRIALVGCMLIPAQLWAGHVPDSEHVVVSAEASIQVVPDMATFHIAIQQTDANASKAKADVDGRSGKVLDIGKKLGLKPADITASQISMRPDYRWERERNVYIGTSVQREIVLVLRDLDKYAELVQKLAEIPVTNLGHIEMGSARMEEHEAAALAKAVTMATSKARSLAEQFQTQLGSIYSIIDNPAPAHGGPVMMMRAATMDEAGAAYESGTIEVRASIQAVFRLATK